ncbi:POP1 ribonuclease P/MRP subunit [Lasioglossum baleicum]|uniref:POP1 ribonuclease P/MRP subunit n=1 Tax=Lasioglossum baleicum TaxID=434251 RepID=UPI003FCECD6E
MAGKEQFDEFLGGSEKLPNEVHVLKLVSSRASEIAAMTHSIENNQQTKLVFQKLPVYMRRRVMSHNAKRLPRRLREAHLNQMTKSGLPPKTKRPSRRYRRRPRNLLSEYNRRQRNKIWLETHIWHAKRFHMVEKWGYRIASHANDRCFKANYRAVAKHCLMQDISYYTCVEIRGPEEILKETLKNHCNPCELTFAAKVFISGTREGTLMFFKRNGYPQFPIGHVHFLWRPSSNSNSKTIWIWVHPSFFDDFLNQIISSFNFKVDDVEPTNSQAMKFSSYKNDKNCKMIVHKNTLNRFRFFGPLTLRVLTETLRLPNVNEKFCSASTIEVEENRMEYEEHSQDNKLWHKEYYSSEEHLETLKLQKQLWELLRTLKSSSQLPPNIVLGFTVLDPRFYLPEKRRKPLSNVSKMTELMPVPPTNANSTPIWDEEVRRKVTKTCVTIGTINKLRSKCLVPGVSNDKHFNEEIMAKIPILLIQKPGVGNTGLSSAIDIVLPAGWAMPFWLACIFRCVRVGALRESKSIAFEYENVKSPDTNDPDTPAYAREASSTKEELIDKYLRYPPNRRVNFTKLRIVTPFYCEWRTLMKEWTSVEDFFVLRDRKLLQLLQDNLAAEENNRSKRNKLQRTKSSPDFENSFANRNCLIRVKVSLLKKGCPKRFAIICMPTAEDIKKYRNDRNWSGPVEKLYPDPNETTRKSLRKNHLALLKRLKKQRIRHRKALGDKLRQMLNNDLQILNYESRRKNLLEASREAVKNQSEKMSQLYLPDYDVVRCSCDREVMGYVTTGDFSFAQAKGIGLGYTTLNSLLELMNKKYPFVLVRNTQTRQYRIAKLEVII